MKKSPIVIIILFLVPVITSSQTLFTYGNYKADAKEFLRAFNKNNQQPAANKGKAMREYLDAYINSRLKIRQAYDLRYDTLPQVKSEVENLRNQIIENYMSDPEAVNRLTKEVFQRSLKDIHAAHIFIADSNNGDTTATRKKLNEVLSRLQKGEDFLSVSQQFSDDPSAKENKGDLDFITVFTLPYEFENIIYSTPPGKYSKPHHSKIGYHIFKNLGERKALGKIKIQHILLAFPPGTDEAGKKQVAKLADSLYQRIQAGDDFGKLAAAFSNDNISAASNGNVPDITVGQYEPAFEKIIWSLPHDSSTSKPFATSYGYHIVRRVSVIPVITNASDNTNKEELKQRVMMDDRWKTAKDFIYTRVKEKAGYKKLYGNDAVLQALSDSLLDYKPAGIGRSMNSQSPLFKIGDTTFTVTEWIRYAQMNRYKPDRSGVKPYTGLMDEFTKNAMYQYYRDHLEDFNEEFRNQMNEFSDGNLFFEIMQQEVWNKASDDSTALLALYEKNKSQYDWKQSAEAVIFFCADETTARSVADQLKKDPADWKKIAQSMNEKVVIDSGRYEWPQIPGTDKTIPKAGSITSVTVNQNDNTASLACILKVYTQSSPRSFEQAKGLVMNDYQTLLEEEWIKKLRKKYPVTIDEKVFASISK